MAPLLGRLSNSRELGTEARSGVGSVSGSIDANSHSLETPLHWSRTVPFSGADSKCLHLRAAASRCALSTRFLCVNHLATVCWYRLLEADVVRRIFAAYLQKSDLFELCYQCNPPPHVQLDAPNIALTGPDSRGPRSFANLGVMGPGAFRACTPFSSAGRPGRLPQQTGLESQRRGSKTLYRGTFENG
jgi:hypothetical protein